MSVEREIHWFFQLQNCDIIFNNSELTLFTVAVVDGVTKVPRPGCELEPFSNSDIMLSCNISLIGSIFVRDFLTKSGFYKGDDLL